MLKLANQPRFSISLPSTALLISLVASLGACATLDPSRTSTTRYASADRPSESFFGYVKDPAERPTGPSFFGYVKDPAEHATGPSFFGYIGNPAEQSSEPTLWGYLKNPAERAVPTQASRASKTPVAVQR